MLVTSLALRLNSMNNMQIKKKKKEVFIHTES